MPPNQIVPPFQPRVAPPTPLTAAPTFPLPSYASSNLPDYNNPNPPSNIYPVIDINRNEMPNKLYAIPILGFLIKAIILIPVVIWIQILTMAASYLTIINSFIVLFTSKYSKDAYNFNLGLSRLTAKTIYFLYGLTDKYPGVSLEIKDNFTVDIEFPENPSKFFAIPIIGGLIRVILLIPYFIYQMVLSYAAFIGVFFSFFNVLVKSKYPESTFELARDSVRVSQATFVYMSGLSDKYPSFHISMNHKIIKIILLVAGALLLLGTNFSSLLIPSNRTKTPKRITSPNYTTTSTKSTPIFNIFK